MKPFSKIIEILFWIFHGVLIVLLVVLPIIFLAVMFDDCPERIFNLLGIAGTEEPKYEALKFLGIGMGGVLVALQALMSYRRAKAMEDAAKAQARATEEQAKANLHTEQGQRQERLKNAIEHLGHESDSVRLGGAYELFHLAKDTLKEDPKERLGQTVLDILCAYIRQTTGKEEYRETHKSEPSEEIQSLLTLLFVMPHRVFENHLINLEGSWLNGASLSGARLSKTVLIMTKAYLQKADLAGAHIQGVDLRNAYLQGADLRDAKLQRGLLSEARLQGANLDSVQLQGADLYRAQLQGTDYLALAELQGADLGEAFLQGADLRGASLQGAILTSARLQGADLRGASLQGAILTSAQLQGADLREASLQGADIKPWSSRPFAEHIKSLIGKETDLSTIIFSGGLTKEDVASLVGGLGYSSGTDGLLCLLRRLLNRARSKPEILTQTLKDSPAEKANKLRKKLTPHIGEPISYGLPGDSGAITGSYTAEDAEKWIAEYKEAMSEVPKDDS